jgi:hypothetical protein
MSKPAPKPYPPGDSRNKSPRKKILRRIGQRDDYEFKHELIIPPFYQGECPPEILKPYHVRDLEGDLYRCNFHVETLAELSLDQCCKLIQTEPHFYLANRGIEWKKTGKHTMKGKPKKNPEPPILEILVSYPLHRPVLLKLPPLTARVTTIFKGKAEEPRETLIMSTGYLLYIVARLYTQIYKTPNSYGVWGHGINDLYFEGFVVSKTEGTVDGKASREVQLLMGS